MVSIIHSKREHMLPYFENPLVKPKLKVKGYSSHPLPLVFNGMGAAAHWELRGTAEQESGDAEKGAEETREPCKPSRAWQLCGVQ